MLTNQQRWMLKKLELGQLMYAIIFQSYNINTGQEQQQLMQPKMEFRDPGQMA